MKKKIILLCAFLLLAIFAFYILQQSENTDEQKLVNVMEKLDAKVNHKYPDELVKQMRQICLTQSDEYINVKHASLCTKLEIHNQDKCSIAFNSVPVDMSVVGHNLYSIFPKYDLDSNREKNITELMNMHDEGKKYFAEFTKSCMCALPKHYMEDLTKEREEAELLCRTNEPS